MTDELMLFLALLAAFTVVLVEWWARRTPKPLSAYPALTQRGPLFAIDRL